MSKTLLRHTIYYSPIKEIVIGRIGANAWQTHFNNIETIGKLIIFIYLFKLHITPIWVKQLQYKSMQTYKRKTTQT